MYIYIEKELTAIDWLLIIWKPDLSEKVDWSLSQKWLSQYCYIDANELYGLDQL